MSRQELVTNSAPVGIQYIILPTCFWVTILDRLVLMADSENSDSPQIKLFREIGWAFQMGDPVLIAKTMHKDYRYIPYPRSLGQSEKTKEEFLEHWTGIISLWDVNTEVSYIGYTSDPICRN
jgi:hypothetical protein